MNMGWYIPDASVPTHTPNVEPSDYREFCKLRDFERFMNEGLDRLRKIKPDRE